MSNEAILRIGVLGAGGFASFASQAFSGIPRVSIIAVNDLNPDAAGQLAQAVGAEVQPDLEAMLRDERIDLIYLGTPPYLHYIQSKKALEAGKHVICEKPAAIKTVEAEELAQYAQDRNLLYVVNLMQRYNPLYAFVRNIIEEKWLGDFVHGYFENYASDSKLSPAHWFWDREKSGGIFIEHGVHFFDMFSGWFGEGRLLHAYQLERAGQHPTLIDRVQATLRYDDALVHFYHGFNQPSPLDRQELKLVFDHGDITLHEWIPVKIRLYGLIQNARIAYFQEQMPGSVVHHHQDPGYSMHPGPALKADDTVGKQAKPERGGLTAHGKFRDISYDAWVKIEAGDSSDKMLRYEQLVVPMLKDQWEWIKNPAHQRIIDSRNAVESLRIAEAATRIAEGLD